MQPADILVRAIERAQSWQARSKQAQTEVTLPPQTLPSQVAEDLLSVMQAKVRAPARLVLACALAKAHQPQLDATCPYTAIASDTAFSGRTYDERDIAPLIAHYRLPLNVTTAFLTPALRNMNQPLRSTATYEGKPRALYQQAVRLLEALEAGTVTAEDLLTHALWVLLDMRDQRAAALTSALDAVGAAPATLSAEDILTLLRQHLGSKNASRLPVLLVAALTETLSKLVGEEMVELGAHNAADIQTGTLGDIEILLPTDGKTAVVTAYEIKARAVGLSDLEHAATKAIRGLPHLQNYLFVTTHPIEPDVRRYATELHGKTGVEFAVLDALSFAKYLLHFFYRQRLEFLEHYQDLLLAEPDSAVRPELKLSWLALRQAAES